MDVNPSSLTTFSHGENLRLGPEGSSMSEVPNELIIDIFSQNPVKEDRNMSLVCKSWSQVIPKLPDPTLKEFGLDTWKNLGFEVEGEIPSIPKDIFQKTRSDRRRFSGEEIAPSCSAILMPKGLTLNKMKKLMEANGTKFDEGSWKKIFDQLGDKPIEKSYWIVMTNDVIEVSRNKSYAVQKAFVEKKSNSECQFPTVLEAVACCVVNFVSSKEYLFGRGDPWTFTRCQEHIDGYSLLVGGFASGGLFVDTSRSFCVHYSLGVAVRRKFC